MTEINVQLSDIPYGGAGRLVQGSVRVTRARITDEGMAIPPGGRGRVYEIFDGSSFPMETGVYYWIQGVAPVFDPILFQLPEDYVDEYGTGINDVPTFDTGLYQQSGRPQFRIASSEAPARAITLTPEWTLFALPDGGIVEVEVQQPSNYV